MISAGLYYFPRGQLLFPEMIGRIQGQNHVAVNITAATVADCSRNEFNICISYAK